MDEIKKMNTKENVKIVTSNDFIMALGLENLSLKARKLLYITISQCKKNDKNFYMYEISVKKFAELMGITSEAVYGESQKITYELLKTVLRVIPKNQKDYEQYTVFSKCKYNHNGVITIKLNPDMTNFLLDLNKEFTQPLLKDFLKMKSSYSIEIWHLMQREMKSKKPGVTDKIEFELSLEELRAVTGTQRKLKQLNDFKVNCFDKAIREIEENCNVKITYKNIKSGKKVVGFACTAVSTLHVDEDEIDIDTKNRVRLGVLRIQKKSKPLSKEEQAEYDRLVENSEQMSLAL